MQLPPPRCGDFVIAGLAVVLGSAPERRDEALVLEPVQGRIERPLLHLQHRIAAFLNELGNGVAVRGAKHERLEDEHVERALHQIPGPVGRFTWTHEPFALSNSTRRSRRAKGWVESSHAPTSYSTRHCPGRRGAQRAAAPFG